MFDSPVHIQPRAIGRADLSTKLRGRATVIEGLRQSGCMRVLFPRCAPALEAVLVNTSGGVTGGDHVSVDTLVGQGSQLTLTTQAAERAYRAQASLTGRITTNIRVDSGGTLHWLPQELILFDGCNLDRRLTVHLAPTAKALLVEPIVFGRIAMGERLNEVWFRDRISVHRNGTPLYLDGISLTGNGAAQLARPAIAGGAGAMSSVVYVSDDAERRLNLVRALLPPLGGASLLAPDVLVARVVAPDSFVLRQSLIPLLEHLSTDTLPKTWRL